MDHKTVYYQNPNRKICSKQYFATVSYDKVLMDAANYSTACNCFQPEQPEVRIQAQI